MRRMNGLMVTMLSAMCLCGLAEAQVTAPATQPATAPASRNDNQESRKPSNPMRDLLRSRDPEQQKQAVALMCAQIDREGKKFNLQTLHGWVEALHRAKLLDQAIEVADRGLRNQPHDPKGVNVIGTKALVLIDQGKIDLALAAMHQAFANNPRVAAQVMQSQDWTAPLAAIDMLPQALEFLDQTTITYAGDLTVVERLLKHRAEALLAANKPQEALGTAKSLFNVSSMTSTSDALALVLKCLQAAYPSDPGLLGRFRAEQLAGAVPAAATRPVADASNPRPPLNPPPSLPS